VGFVDMTFRARTAFGPAERQDAVAFSAIVTARKPG
jgi:hypothetical protein